MPRKRYDQLNDATTQLVYSASKRKETELRSRNVVGGYRVRTTYDYAMAGGAGAGAVHATASHRLARTLIVEVDDKPLAHVVTRTLQIIKELFGTNDVQINPTAVAAGTAEAARLSNVEIPTTIERCGKSVIRDPYQLALATAFSKVRLAADWGAYADLFTNAITGVPTLSSVDPQLYELVLEGIPNVAGYAPLVIRHETFNNITTGADKSFELPWVMPGMEVLAIIVETLEDTVGGENWAYSDSVVDNIALEIGGEIRQAKVDWAVAQELNVPRFELASKKAGVVVFDAMEDGSIEPGDLWTHVGRQKARIICETNAPVAPATRQICVTALMTGGKWRAARARARAAAARK